MQCNTCKAELRWDEPRECWTCDVCRPRNGEIKPKFNDGAIPDIIFNEVQEKEIRRIIVDELKYLNSPCEKCVDEVKDWRGEAKKLNIPLYDKELNRPRKKEDVLKDIELKSQEDNNETP